MVKQVILLAGLHKTATTSIQQTCAANQQRLRRVGVGYPTWSKPGEAGSNHTLILNCFKQDPASAGLMRQSRWTEAEPGYREQVLARFARVVDDAPGRLLLAAESVSLFTRDELEAMKGWFAERGCGIRLICNVRHLSSWINSMIAQRVTSGVRQTITQAVAEYAAYGSIVRKRIENIRRVFPEAEFHSHEQATRHPAGPVGHFLDNAGIQVPPPFRFVRANEGSSDLATRLVSIVNEKFGRFDDAGRPNPDYYGNQRLADAARTLAGRKFALRPDEAAPILPFLEADNAWLKEALGPAFHDERIGFRRLEPDWTPESLAQFEQIVAPMPAPVRDWVVANRARLGIPPA
jgi:hypothetical protein